MKIGKLFITILCVCLMVNGFSQKNKNKEKVTIKSQTGFSESEQLAHTRKFVEGVKERLLGNIDVAEKLFREVILLDSTHDAARFEYANILILKRRLHEATIEAQKAVALNDTNIWYKVLLGELYSMTGNFAEAEKLWKYISEAYPDNVEYLNNYSLALIYQNKLKEAVKVYDQIEIQIGVNDAIIDAKKNIWLHLNDVEKAVAEVEKLVEIFPYDPKYYLQIANLYMVNQMENKAIPYIEKAQAVDPENAEVNLTLYSYYKKNKDEKKAYDVLKKAFASPELDIDEKVKILISYYPSFQKSEKQKQETFDLLEILVKTHPDSPIAWSIYADFLSKDNRFEEAVNAFEKVILYDDSKYLVWEQYLAILAELGWWEKLYEQSVLAVDLFPTQAFPYFMNALAAIQQELWSEAISKLEEGRKYIYSNDAMLVQFYVFLADAYHHEGDNKKSDEYFEKVLLKDPNNATALNNYSYYLSLRNERLDYAVELSKKANHLEPNNFTFEDTYAWVLFKKGDLKNAKLWIEKALSRKDAEKSPDILEHYGDILNAENNKEKAVLYWQKAVDAGGNSPELLQKINSRK